MAGGSTTDSLVSDSSTNERHRRSDGMNPIIVQQMAQYRMDAFDREAESRRRTELVRGETGRQAPIRLLFGAGRSRRILVGPTTGQGRIGI